MACIHAARHQFLHLLTAAEGLGTCVVDHLYDIAAHGTDIKFHIFHIDFLHLLEVFVFLYGLILPEEFVFFRDFLTKIKREEIGLKHNLPAQMICAIVNTGREPANARQVEKLGLGNLLDYKTITANALGNSGTVQIIEDVKDTR